MSAPGFRIGVPRAHESPGRSHVGVDLATPDGPLALRCEVAPAGPLSVLGDVFLPPVLLAAMLRGTPLTCEAPVSARLLAALPRLQGLLAGFCPELRVVPVSASATRTSPSGAGVGTFYSGGIDSCDTLLRHSRELTHMVTLHGFEASASDPGRGEIGRLAAEVAAEFGITLVEVWTNLREALLPGFQHFWISHGAFLAMAGHALAPRVRRLYVASSNLDVPLGTHRDIDPLWSGESVEFVHDDSEPTRCGKARNVARHPFLLERLRVCQSGLVPGRNCGRCDKCVRTLVNLRLAGVMRPSAFDQPLRLGRVRYARLGWLSLPYAKESLRVAEQQGDDPELIAALRDCVETRPWRGWRRPVTQVLTRYWKLREQLWS